MRSALLILDRIVAVIQNQKRRIADAEAREANARQALKELRYEVLSFRTSLGLDEALSTVSEAAGKTEEIARALGDLKRRAKQADAALREVKRALDVPDEALTEQVVATAKHAARRSDALKILHPILRPKVKSAASFADYIVTNAGDKPKLRRYLGLKPEDMSG